MKVGKMSAVFYINLLNCFIIILLITGCSREPGKAAVPSKSAKVFPIGEAAVRTTLLATIADDEKPLSNDPSLGAGFHPSVSAEFQVIFSGLGDGVAYTAQKNEKVYVVHNNSSGRQYASVGTVALSPDGRRIAYGALVDNTWRMVTDGIEGRSFNAVGTPVFSPDGLHVAYQAMLGERWFLVVDNTLNSGTPRQYVSQEFSADSKKIVYVESAGDNSAERLVVSDLVFKKQKVMKATGSLMIMNSDKTRIAAVSKEDSKQRVIEFSFDSPDAVKKGPMYDVIHYLAFGPDGISLAYDADRDGEHLLILNGREDRIPKKTLVGPPVIRPDLKAVGAIIAEHISANYHGTVNSADNNASLHQAFVGSGRKEKDYEEAADLVYNSDGSVYAYEARKGHKWFVVVNGREGPAFDRVVTPVFSPDNKRLVYRARKNGKRFVVVADADGNTISQHPAYEQVFKPVFTTDGKSVAYGVKDGNKLIWNVVKLPF